MDKFGPNLGVIHDGLHPGVKLFFRILQLRVRGPRDGLTEKRVHEDFGQLGIVLTVHGTTQVKMMAPMKMDTNKKTKTNMETDMTMKTVTKTNMMVNRNPKLEADGVPRPSGARSTPSPRSACACRFAA